MKWLRRCSISGGFGDLKIPLLLMLLYIFCGVETHKPASFGLKVVAFAVGQCGRHSQVGCLAGAAHLLNDNAGVLR